MSDLRLRFHRFIGDERGASMLISLIVFLVATMVSVVILTSAVTSVKVLDDDRGRERDYLLVSSGTSVFAHALETSSVTVRSVVTMHSDGSQDVSRDVSGSGPYGGLIADCCDKLLSGSGFGSESRNLTLSVDGTDDVVSDVVFKTDDTDFGDLDISISVSGLVHSGENRQIASFDGVLLGTYSQRSRTEDVVTGNVITTYEANLSFDSGVRAHVRKV